MNSLKKFGFSFVLSLFGVSTLAQKRPSQPSLNLPDLSGLEGENLRADGLAEILRRTARTPSAETLRERIRIFHEAGLLALAAQDSLTLFDLFSVKRSDVVRFSEILMELGAFDLLAKRMPAIESLLTGQPPAEWIAAKGSFFLRNSNPVQANKLLGDLRPPRNLEDSKALARFFLSKGYAEFFVGSEQEALDAWRDLALGFSGVEPYKASRGRLLRAQLLFTQGRLESALAEVSAVPRNSPQWFESVRLGAWAAYRRGDYNLTLGQLMTLHSPYLVGKFSAESFVLEAATLYQLCHYASAKKSLQDLRSRYNGFLNTLKRFENSEARSYRGVVRALNYARGERTPPPGYSPVHWDRLMDGVLQSESFSEADELLTQIDYEQRLLRKSFLPKNRFETRLMTSYQKFFAELRNEAMRLGLKGISSRLPLMRQEVSDSFENALAIEVEINSRLRERLALQSSAVQREVDFETQINKGFEFWPFQGEFWRDEVANYFFATTGVCETAEGSRK